MRNIPCSALLGLLSLIGCQGERPTEIARTLETGGPRVVFDLEARPLPEIPLPNDIATRYDPSSPTGRRVNVSDRATTEYEARTRRKFAELDGFGTFSPIAVAFSAPLDLRNLYRRHHDNNDFRDDAVYLLNVGKNCSRFGEEVALDFGSGRFPLTLFRRATLTPSSLAPEGFVVPRTGLFTVDGFETHGTSNNILFEERNEDRNGNGTLDPGEDLDDDGHLDVANFIDPSACDDLSPVTQPEAHDRCVADHLMGWYERETNSLILRPVWPLEEGCTYAVVLTNRLVDAEGRAVVSPFAAVHHRDQLAALSPVPELLARYDLGARDISFAWSFTTGRVTRDLELLRRGLYGSGPFASLGQEFPVSALELWRSTGAQAGRAMVPGACAADAISRFWRIQSEWEPNRCALEADMVGISGIFGGTFRAPNLLIDKDGRATPKYPDDQDESWDVDSAQGKVVHGSTDVSFWCALPAEHSASGCQPGNPEGRPFCRPFPVILYAHGYGGSRVEIASGHVGRTTSMGYAMCALDAYGHGLNRLYNADDSLEAAFFRGRLEATIADLGLGAFEETLLRGRDRDLNNDGVADPGGDMWTSDVFHTRDMVRQTVLEHIQFVRILRSIDGSAKDVAGNLLGDFDGDGRVDLGGAANTISMWGISLGGIITGVAAGAEPSLDAASPNAGGAGLVDVAVRSSQAGVPEAVLMPLLGPFIEGCVAVDEHDRPVAPGLLGRGCFSELLPGGVIEWGFRVADLNRSVSIRAGQIEGGSIGDEIELLNLENGERAVTHVSAHGLFRLSVAADAMPPNERRGLFGRSDEDTTEMVANESVLARLGSRLKLVVRAPDRSVRAEVDRFPSDIRFMNTLYPAGLPLVSLQEGLGLRRNSPRLRRFMGLASMAIAPADPASWAQRVGAAPGERSYDPNASLHRTRVLMMPTAGDSQVPVNTGLALARATGLLGSWKREPEKYPPEAGWRELFANAPGMDRPVDQLLLDRFIPEGDPRLQRFADNPLNPNVIFDIDDVSDGRATFSCGPEDWSATNGESRCPAELLGRNVSFSVPRQTPPLRLNRPPGGGSFDALRVPVLRPAGQHGIYNAQPFRTFDADAFMVNFTTRYLGTRGSAVDHPAGCDCSASLVPRYSVNGRPDYPSVERECLPSDLKVCSSSCAAAWGITTAPMVQCSAEQ